MVSNVDSLKFAVSSNDDVKQTQKQLLEEIREVSKKIQKEFKLKLKDINNDNEKIFSLNKIILNKVKN